MPDTETDYEYMIKIICSGARGRSAIGSSLSSLSGGHEKGEFYILSKENNI